MRKLIKLSYFLFLCFLISCSSDDSDDPPTYDLDDIQGKWYRVGGNNPANNGMLVNVNGNTGTVEIPVGSGFLEGDIKWKEIVATAERSYAYKELGSDYDYYEAVMDLGTDDTLRINVANSGSGNVQKWVRTYTPEPELNECMPYEPQTNSDVVTGIWSEANEFDEYPGMLPAPSDPAGGYYVVTLSCSVSVPAINITVSGDPSSIINGSAAGSSTPHTRKVAFLAHPGVSYDVTVNPFINGGNFPEEYTISWEYIGIMDCFETNDVFGQAKFIPKNETLDAFANAGIETVGSQETMWDWYKVTLATPSKLRVEIEQSPNDQFMRMKFFRSDNSELTKTLTDISGNSTSQEPGTLYYGESNGTLDPGIYYIAINPQTLGNRVVDFNAEEIIPQSWTMPYKFKVTAIAP